MPDAARLYGAGTALDGAPISAMKVLPGNASAAVGLSLPYITAAHATTGISGARAQRYSIAGRTSTKVDDASFRYQ